MIPTLPEADLITTWIEAVHQLDDGGRWWAP
jgi:hypothetical protein